MEKSEFIVKKSSRLSKAIINEVPFVSFALVQKSLRNKDVLINGKRVNKDCDVCVGDKITLFAKIERKLTSFKTIYEDENVLVVFKNHKVEVARKDKSHSSSITLEEMTGCTACHRLDRNTEGLVLLSKNERATKEIKQAFKNRQINKFYTALVFGSMEKDSEELHAFLLKDSENSLVKVNSSQGEEIITKYKVLERKEDMTVVEVELVTGKTHQIRAHMSYINHPVVGDEKYCFKEYKKQAEFYAKEFNGYALTSTKLTFNFNEGSYLSYLNKKVITCQPSWKV